MAGALSAGATAQGGLSLSTNDVVAFGDRNKQERLHCATNSQQQQQQDIGDGRRFSVYRMSLSQTKGGSQINKAI